MRIPHLKAIIAALESSKPTHDHYPEPVQRHQDALAAAKQLLAIAEHSVMPGIAEHALAGEIAAAVLADEQGEGCDLAGGLFGTQMTTLIRRIVDVYLAARQPDTDEQYADEQALIDHLDSLMNDGGQGGEKWEPAQAAIAGIIAAHQPVGEPVAYIEHFADQLSRVEVTLHGIRLGIGKHAVYAAAAPAQAVDLDKMHMAACAAWDKHQRACRVTTVSMSLRKVCEALIDGKEAGNG